MSDLLAATEVSTDNLLSLEEKVYQTIGLLKAAREGKAAAERDAAKLLEQLTKREEEIESLRGDIVGLRKEREDVRSRVEKLLKQIDSIAAE